MRPTRSLEPAVALLALVALLAAGACAAPDPRERVLRERARWTVQPLSWTETPEGGVLLTVRVAGPVHSELDRLTLRVDLVGEDGQPLEPEWTVLDLSEITRGVPREMGIRIAPRGAAVADLSVDPLLEPGPDDEPHMPELRP